MITHYDKKVLQTDTLCLQIIGIWLMILDGALFLSNMVNNSQPLMQQGVMNST